MARLLRGIARLRGMGRIITQARKTCLFLIFWVLTAILLAGCNPDSGALIEIIYPSGYTRTPYIPWDEVTPVEGTDYQLQAQKSANYNESHTYDLRLLNGDGSLLHEFPGIGQRAMRGEAAENGTIWICSEWWNAVHHNGYLDGQLTKSLILQVRPEDGAVLFQEETGQGELYLTSSGTRCYFYRAGEAEQSHWFGLVKTPVRSAQIYYRDAQNWEDPQTVYIFDYADQPDIAAYSDSQLKARFYLAENQVRAAWESTDRVLTEAGKYQSVFSEKIAYEIPLETTS